MGLGLRNLIRPARFATARLVDRASFAGKTFRVEDAILVAGAPRSGTTWVMELLASIPGYASVFEPLHRSWFPAAAGFGTRPYAPPGAPWPAMRAYMEEMLAGRSASLRPGYRVDLPNIRRRLRATKLLIKFVRANRLLPWLSGEFAVRAIVFVVRHPCATIASQIETGIAGYFLPMGEYPARARLLEEAGAIGSLAAEQRERLATIEHAEERLAAAWALDHLVPLADPAAKRWHVASYERLAGAAGADEVERLLAALGAGEHARAAAAGLRRPSLMAADRGNVTDSGRQLRKWQRVLTPAQIENIARVLAWFDMEFDASGYRIGARRWP